MNTNLSKKIPVLVAGALGKMGSEVIKAVSNSPDCELVAAIDNSPEKQGMDIGEVLGIGSMDIEINSDFEGSLCVASQFARDSFDGNGAVLIDFTHPNVVYEHTRAAIAYGVNPVIGTTGLTREQINDLSEFAKKASVGTAVIPNFSVGMVLLQQAAAAAAAFYDYAELTELHHNFKADAPSGTCIKTAELIEEVGKPFNESLKEEKKYKAKG